MTSGEVDACIIGSGAGGGAAAYALTRAGFRVAVIEKGPHYQDADFFHDELTICRRSFFVPSVLSEPHVFIRNPGATPERTSDGWIACCVGGGTVHMSGYFFRLRPNDFRMRTLFGSVPGASVADWPIEPREMDPFYDEVERVIGVSGDAAREGRATPYPLGPIISHPSAALVDEACHKLDLRSFPTPRAIISADYGGRPACHYCGFCGSYGCEVGAKSSSLSTFLSIAQKTNKLEIVSRAMVASIETDGDKATGITYVDSKGARQRVRARVVIVACSAIETARLLLASGSPRHPDGLANSSGQVGKNLMFCTLASAYARYPRSSPQFPDDGRIMPFLDRAVLDYYELPREAHLPHAKGGSLLFMLAHKNPIFQAERVAKEPSGSPVFGVELKRRLREFFVETRTIEVESFGEFLPHDGCQVTLDPDVKDRFGLPVARVRASLHPASLAASDFLAQKGRAILEQTGARTLGSYPGDRIYPVLQAGTARMGSHPKSSVLDATGCTHDVRNLYVADSSGFPSAGGAPFTLTIMANALRVASHIVKRASRGEL